MTIHKYAFASLFKAVPPCCHTGLKNPSGSDLLLLPTHTQHRTPGIWHPNEYLNIITDFQHAEGVVLHIEMAELIPDNSELTLLFIQLQQAISERHYPIYITHSSHTVLTKGNKKVDQLLIKMY